ncbi:XRE family transcriptional regulator [Eggerthella lenta]|uniref:helix-turn-helix domain-containing protein n=1 Tax=Eggerthella lenta TaxID=84112 RepID=UPI000DF82C4F|nr:helix-turn-helix transcriptional regulator [Eggerthella lenta]RDB79707.1 XRE family transcriptional regulator [Eggerthella lenta]
MSPTSKKGSFMNVEIAQRLAAMRREQGYSQEELAERLGLSRQAVSKWERAESSPDTGNLIALAKLYGVSLDDLLRIDEDVVDDVAFEEKDKHATAAAQARATAEQAHQAPPAQPQPQPQPVQQPYYGAAPMPQQPVQPAQPQAPYAPQASQAPESYDAQLRRPRGPWSTFPYPVPCVLVFLGGGFLFGWWHPGWFVFLTIPLYYWIAHIIENDPNYRANRR